MFTHRKDLLYLLLILFAGLYLRTFNINWDNGYYFHPDERAIVMFVTPLDFPSSFANFIDPQSPLNPKFFAYGNFPLYLLKIASEIAGLFNPILKEYGGMYYVGRPISAAFDTGTILLVFLLGSRISRKTGLFAATLYSFSVFPIQLSHFFAVDTILTFFMVGTILFLIKFFEYPSYKNTFIVGLFLGLSLATKISSLILTFTVFFVIFLLLKEKLKTIRIKRILTYLLILTSFSILVFVITQPYVLLDFDEFITQASLQSKMSSDAFIFPYTLQYVGKTPYLYELKNIFLWGFGPIATITSILGLFFVSFNLFRGRVKSPFFVLITLVFFASYFILFGQFAVGWMRYMLPIYPFLAIFGGYFIYEIMIKNLPKKVVESYTLRKTSLVIFIILIVGYPISFLDIYLKPNTRIQASNWIQTNVPLGSSIAIEHWDDALPVSGGHLYNQLTLPLYDMDDDKKWSDINKTLAGSDYIIIASNRLYRPLMRMTDCQILPTGRCYKKTSKYYERLFSEDLGFMKVAEFTQYPTLPIFNIAIVDDDADESFTVYDHPKIMVFKKRDIE